MAKTKNEEKKVFTLEDLSRTELEVRYNANVAERKRLAEENKYLIKLHRSATSSEKKSTAEAKIAALQAKLDALRNPTPVIPEEVLEAISAETLAS
ncbi:MAG: hypothetical protein LBD41_03160 [Clostridiales Family XIII bacterium]|jgi:hypothetical protein|nr:hypothetical protein [Clostridiales Family XIII bacterium]